MEYGEVVLEHRPIVICQCEYNKCLVCELIKELHPSKEDYPENQGINPHDYYQRSRVTGPRVVVDNKTFRGICFKCKKEYEVEVRDVSDRVEGQIKYDEVVPY